MLVSLEGFILSDTFYMDGIKCKIIGTTSVGYKASEAIDSIKTEKGEYFDLTRGELWKLEKKGKIVLELPK